MPRKLKLYPVNGEMITIHQAAVRAFVSVDAIRFQLTNHNGDMQAVMDYYDRKNSGEGNEMRKIIDDKPEKAAKPYDPELGEGWRDHCEKTDVAEAAEKIAEILGIEPDDPETTNVPLAGNAGMMRVEKEEAPQPAIQIEELAPAQRLDLNKDRLQLYNAAIEALVSLQEDDEVCRAKMSDRVNAIEQELRRLRIQVFEPMIDWAAMAGK